MKLLHRIFGKSPEVVRGEARAQAAHRLSTMSTAALIPATEAQLGAAWQAFDKFQDHPEPVTLAEYAKCVEILRATVDVLQERFETHS